jgi:hypothetical protein
MNPRGGGRIRVYGVLCIYVYTMYGLRHTLLLLGTDLVV